jgi:hypothetical protein
LENDITQAAVKFSKPITSTLRGGEMDGKTLPSEPMLEAHMAPPLRARKLRAKVRTARIKTNQARGMR